MNVARDTVRQGENIVSLTSRLTGDPTQWIEIVRLNNLQAPYITDQPTSTTLTPGEAVLYPAPDAPAGAIDPDVLAALTYKRDLLLDGDDLSMSVFGHIGVESGLVNLISALTRRIKTAIGAHPFHPRYGSLLHTHLGEVADMPRLHLACVDAKNAVMRDPRVQSCTVTAVWEWELLKLDVDVTPIAPGSPFRFNVKL